MATTIIFLPVCTFYIYIPPDRLTNRPQAAFGASTSTAHFDLPYGQSVTSGVFTAKATGVYMFFIKIRIQDSSTSSIVLQWTINDVDEEDFQMCVRACVPGVWTD